MNCREISEFLMEFVAGELPADVPEELIDAILKALSRER